MNLRSSVLIGCLLISTASVGGAYLVAGYWQILPLLLVLAPFWIFINNQSGFWSASSLLVVFVMLAGIGITINLSPNLMIITCSSALVGWDLLLFTQDSVQDQTAKTDLLFEQQHLKSLALAAVIGLIVSFIISSINLQIPFGVTYILVLIMTGCLIFGMRYINKEHQ
jgi:hypothetical protein